MGKKINIRPTTSVYATYKNIKYDPWTAIAEFVDNSTQSYYDNEDKLKATKYWNGLTVEVIYERDDHTGDRLIIRDNAHGMSFQDFQRAIVLDSPPKNRTRSEFGMGLKTAACWFGKNWSVESTELGSGIKYYASVDVEALRKYKNEEIEVEERECSRKDHGTTITIWNLNRTISGRQIGKTKDQLRGMYRVDLRTGEISITYNGEKLFYESPDILTEELPDGTTKVWKQEVDFSIPYGDEKLKVTGFFALRAKASTSAAGFALLRNGRVIVGGYENAYRPEEIFEKSNSFVYQRLFGELNLDGWPVTQTKDAFDWYNGLEDSLIERLNELCGEYKTKAKNYRVTKKTSVGATVTNTVETFSNAGLIDQAHVEDLTTNNTPAGEMAEGGSSGKDENEPPTNVSTQVPDGIVLEGATSKKITFQTRSGEYTVNLVLKTGDPNQNWLNITPNGTDIYDLEWNIRHPFFKPFIDEPEFLEVMQNFVFAFALSEIESYSSSEDGKVDIGTVRMRMNNILKEVARGGT